MLIKRYIIIGLIVFLVFVVFFTNFFIAKNWLSRPLSFVKNFFSYKLYEENLILKEENQNLKAQLQQLTGANPPLQARAKQYLSTKVLSTYPFNIKNQLLINVGSQQGIKALMPITFGENILVGQIVEVSEKTSKARTVFDPLWQLPVRIGEKEIDGFFKGGTEPIISLIDKSGPIQAGDAVYSASTDFPYGLKIGEVANIKEASAGIFKEATLKMPFNINELREVKVITQ